MLVDPGQELARLTVQCLAHAPMLTYSHTLSGIEGHHCRSSPALALARPAGVEILQDSPGRAAVAVPAQDGHVRGIDFGQHEGGSRGQ
ncbi:hypothetical protein GCM10027199_80550 [Amycolatopsis magusensis]